jgi:hypothetical protein
MTTPPFSYDAPTLVSPLEVMPLDELASPFERLGAAEADLETDELEYEVDDDEAAFEPEMLIEPGSTEELDLAEAAGDESELEGTGITAGFADLVRRGMASAAVLVALAGGERDENQLTNRVLFARHPELGGRPLRPENRALAAEWLQIRDHVVRPLLNRQRGGPAGSPTARQRMRTQQLREAWAAYAGRKDLMDTVDMLGHRVHVNPRIADAARALGRALEAAGYRAERVGGFADRVIKGSTRRSLHGYGIAIDVDARHNPHRWGKPGPARFSSAATQAERRADVAAGRADTSFTPQQVAAATSIRTVDGIPVFF